MADNIEKVYSQAFFDAISETGGSLNTAAEELNAVNTITDGCPDFIKLMDSPIVTADEKIALLDETFKEKLTPYTLNFLKVLTEEKRWSNFSAIHRQFSKQCDEALGIARVTVSSAFPLTEEQRASVSAKMAEIIGKRIELTEKTDRSLVGGLVVDYGDLRFDGSVKTRLEGLKESFSRLISD